MAYDAANIIDDTRTTASLLTNAAGELVVDGVLGMDEGVTEGRGEVGEVGGTSVVLQLATTKSVVSSKH
jgi:hypothetical protein